MDVILLSKVRNLGNLGEKVKVKPGFGRNYLIPRSLAVRATDENMKRIESLRAELEQKETEKFQEAEARANVLNELHVVVKANASEEGRLYGSVGPLEIARAVTDLGHILQKREILMPNGPIYTVGNFTVEARLHSEVLASLKVEVLPN